METSHRRQNCVSELADMSLVQYTSDHVHIHKLRTCQVLRKSKSEIARAPLIFAYNLVIQRAEKSGAQVLRVRFFSLFKQS